MSIAVAYWVLMLVWLALGLWSVWPNIRAGGPNLILFLLLALVGWKLFGAPVQHG